MVPVGETNKAQHSETGKNKLLRKKVGSERTTNLNGFIGLKEKLNDKYIDISSDTDWNAWPEKKLFC